MLHIHLDPLGGVAGDMFVAALLECFPEHRDDVMAAAQKLAGVACRRIDHNDGILAGARFCVEEPPHHHAHHHDGHHHHHTHWREIRGRIEDSGLSPAAKIHAVGIFACLAEAEARELHLVPRSRRSCPVTASGARACGAHVVRPPSAGTTNGRG